MYLLRYQLLQNLPARVVSRPRRSLNTRQIGQYKLVDPVIQTTEIEKKMFKTLFLKNHWSEVLKRAWKHPHVGVDSIYDPQK